MIRTPMHKLISIAIASLLVIFALTANPGAAQAINAPELLPQETTSIIDLGRFLSESQEEALNQKLDAFEQNTGWKVKVLTQVDRTPGRAVKEFWGLNDHSVMLVADSRGNNLLNFSVGNKVYDLLPRGFWIELQSRYGNQFFVRDRGQDQSILSSVNTIMTCLEQDGCLVVPGLPQEQWLLTLTTSILGGLVFGFAGHPRHEDEIFAWRWALVLTPLWGMLLVAFGIGPVISRTSDLMPIVRNIAGFIGGAAIAYMFPFPPVKQTGKLSSNE
jgi:hypothetical protein